MKLARIDEGRPWPFAAGELNPPGNDHLLYRVGDYGSFLDLMLDRLVDPDGGREGLTTLATVVADSASPQELTELRPEQLKAIRPNLTETENWLIGLLKGWATVSDVLVFYQERLIQEGYLRTARELRSVYELGRLLHLRPRPAVAGTVDLAFGASKVDGLPKRVRLEAGTIARSVPHDGAPPQVFETVSALVVDASVNWLEPTPPHEQAPAVLDPNATSALLAGASTGLAAGSSVLITGRLMPGGKPVRALRQLRSVKARVAADLTATEITWQPSLHAPGNATEDEAKIVEPAVYAFRSESHMFGYNAPSWQDQPLAIQQQVQPLLGGVMVLESAVLGWQTRNQGLSGAAVGALAIDREGTVFASIAGEGVMRSRDLGRNWDAANRGLQDRDVTILEIGPDGSVYAGTGGGGVYRTTDQGSIWEPLFGRATAALARRSSFATSPATARLPITAIRALAFERQDNRTDLLVGCDSGVFRSQDHGTTWQPTNRGLPGVKGRGGDTDLVVFSLALAGEGESVTAFMGTARGVFKKVSARRPWRPASLGLPRTDPFSGLSSTVVTALATYRDRRGVDRLVAGTAEGLFLSEDGGLRWRAATDGPAGPIRSLRVVADPITVLTTVFAVTDGGLWRSEDGGKSWQRVELGIDGKVTAMVAGRSGAPLIVAMPFGGFVEDEWPGFRPASGYVDFDRVVSGVLPGGWIALQSEDRSRTGVYAVTESGAVHREDFLIAGTVTRASVTAKSAAAVRSGATGDGVEAVAKQPDLASFRIRRTAVFGSSELLELAPRLNTSPALAVATLAKRLASLASLDPNRRVIVAGPRSERESPTEGSPSAAGDDVAWATAPEDPSLDGESPGDMDAGEALSDDTPPSSAVRATTASALASALRGIVESARDKGAGTPTRSGDDPPLPPLSLSGDAQAAGPQLAPETIGVFGNIVEALEGATIRDEVLGDGDAAQPHQRFVLAQPLAFVPDAPPRPDLTVSVRGEQWEAVTTLIDSTPEARVYRLDVEPDGRATLVFGDGLHGARIPSGRGNVTATYRTGLAPFAPRPRTVTMAENRPLGLATVSNPAAATQGAPADTMEVMRARAPHLLRTLGRVVSIRDYADFAATFPGIVRAKAWSLPIAGNPAVQLTIAALGGVDSPSDGPLVRSLRRALDRVRAGDIVLSIAGFKRVQVRITGTLRVDPEFTPASIEHAARALLAERFGFDAAHFEGAMTAAEVTSAMQKIRGVRGVDVDTFESDRPLPEEAPPLRWRRARGPYWERASGLRAAELVMVGPMPELEVVVVR